MLDWCFWLCFCPSWACVLCLTSTEASHIPELFSLHSWVVICTVVMFSFHVRIAAICTVFMLNVSYCSEIKTRKEKSNKTLNHSLLVISPCCWTVGSRPGWLLVCGCGSVAPWNPHISGWEKQYWSSVWPPSSLHAQISNRWQHNVLFLSTGKLPKSHITTNIYKSKGQRLLHLKSVYQKHFTKELFPSALVMQGAMNLTSQCPWK